jgi:hypothetical protein
MRDLGLFLSGYKFSALFCQAINIAPPIVRVAVLGDNAFHLKVLLSIGQDIGRDHFLERIGNLDGEVILSAAQSPVKNAPALPAARLIFGLLRPYRPALRPRHHRSACTGRALPARCARIALITAGSSMHATMRIAPPLAVQVSTSMSNTRFRRCAYHDERDG